MSWIKLKYVQTDKLFINFSLQSITPLFAMSKTDIVALIYRAYIGRWNCKQAFENTTPVL